MFLMKQLFTMPYRSFITKNIELKSCTFALYSNSCRGVVRRRGKSGQRRASYFLTGRQQTGNCLLTASATENYRPDSSG